MPDDLAGDGEYLPCGNHGGFAYRLDGAGLSDSEHEAQTSALAARPGAVLLDYLRAVLPDEPAVMADVRGWLGQTTARHGGWRGWYDRSASVLDGGLLAWCSDKERAAVEGVLIDLPGRACASLGDRLIPFLAWCLHIGRVTRADFAIDDFAGRLTRERILDAEASGALVTRWREMREVSTRQRGKVSGWTFYLGSRKYEAMARIYDKAAERGLPDVSWVRFELETKHALADALCREYFSSGSAAIVGQIARRVRFAEPVAGDTNARRWPSAAWWLSLLGSVAPGPSLVCGEVPACTVASLAAFVERQAGPALAVMMRADGGDLGRLAGILERSAYRLKSRHLSALALASVG